jgi:hypothetical protein
VLAAVHIGTEYSRARTRSKSPSLAHSPPLQMLILSICITRMSCSRGPS